MALVKNHNIKLYYTLDKYDSIENYRDKLNEEQYKELPHTIEKDLTINNTYCKITTLNGSKEKMCIILSIYKDSTKDVLIDTKSYYFIPSIEDGADNPFKQGYLFLKTLPEYADAIDILED